MRLALALIVLLALPACGDRTGSTSGPDLQQVLPDTLVLAPGSTVMIDILRVSFLEVQADSRCPTDVMCVWEGDAAVEIALGLGMGPSHPFVLHTSAGPSSVEFGGYRVTLLRLAPEPRSTTPTDPGDYRASLLVERFVPGP